jgi:hypothetical protein
MKRLAHLITRFACDRSGNIAMMFGIVLIALVLAAGLAIDFQRLGAAKVRMQEAGDAAVLAAARYKGLHPTATDAELTKIGRRMFNGGMEGFPDVEIKAFSIKFLPATGTFDLDVNGRLQTLLMRVGGSSLVALGAQSEVRLGKPPYLEVALALDVTGSMNQKGKLSDMKNAARDFVKAMFSHPDAEIKIGVVPFAQYVSVGESVGGAPWLAIGGPGWKGCVGSRTYPLNVEDSKYDVEKVPTLNGAPCPDALKPLSDDEDAIDAMIDGLNANGWTYIPTGLFWGWTLVSPQAPFTEGAAYAELATLSGYKAVVLMTDGENTRAPDYPTHNSGDVSLANDLTKELCANIKKEKILIYTIAFDVTDPTIKAILENCATAPSNYFDAANSGELVAAFQSIASSLRSISLSR